MQLLAFIIPSLLLLLQPLSVLATTPDNDSMKKPSPPVSVPATTSDKENMEKLNPLDPVLATTPDNKHVEKIKPGGVRREGTVNPAEGPCSVLLKSTTDPDVDCMDGGEHVMTISDGAVEGNDGDGDGKDASMQENKEPVKRKRVHHPTLYTWLVRGMKYHIEINSPLGETYRNLSTRAEQRAFAMEHGTQRPAQGTRLWAAR